MIKLEVELYCQNCPLFEADVEKDNELVYNPLLNDTIRSCDTVIRCARRYSCDEIYRHIERNINYK